MDQEQFIAKAQELRQEWENARLRLMEFCYEIEQSGEWREWGIAMSFDEFLESEDIVKTSSYLRFKRIHKSHGAEALREVSAEAVDQAGMLKDERAQKEFLEYARTWEKTNNRPLSHQTATSQRKQVEARFAGQNQTTKKRQAGYATTYSENETLREENARLRKENATLRSENKQLRKKLDKYGSTEKAA